MQLVHPFPDPNHYDASDPFYSAPGAKRHHLGSDYSVGVGTPARAVGDGVIFAVAYSGVLGWVTGLKTDDGVCWGYAHQDRRPGIAVGTRVVRGQYGVAVSGNSGTASDGPHLHLSAGYTEDAIWGSEPLFDPHAYIQAHLTGTAGGEVRPITQYQEEEDMLILNVIKEGDGVPAGLYVATPTGVEGATGLLLGLLEKNPGQFVYTCYGEEAAALNNALRNSFVRNLALYGLAPSTAPAKTRVEASPQVARPLPLGLSTAGPSEVPNPNAGQIEEEAAAL